MTCVDSDEGKTALHWAAGSTTSTAASCITQLLKKGRGLLESRDLYGRTPLVASAVSGCVECVEVLLVSGASVETVDDQQRTPIHWAAGDHLYSLYIFISVLVLHTYLHTLTTYTPSRHSYLTPHTCTYYS